MNYLGFIAHVSSHIPDKGQVMVCYYRLYAKIRSLFCGLLVDVPGILYI
jgi:hypothetical protein